MADTPAVNDPVVQDTTTTESAPVETQQPEAVQSETEIADKAITESLAKQDTEDSTEVTPAESKEPEQGETEAEVPQSAADERKQQLNTEIRDLVSQRNTLRAEVEKANAEVYQPATEDELVGQVNPDTGQEYSRVEAKLAAFEQAQELKAYNDQVADNQLTLATEAQKVVQDFPMFNPDSDQYKPELAAKADALLGKNLILDQNTGQPIGSNVSPYELYQTIAMAAQASAVEGQIQGQKATEKMLASVDSASGAAPPAKTEDDNFLKGLRGDKN